MTGWIDAGAGAGAGVGAVDIDGNDDSGSTFAIGDPHSPRGSISPKRPGPSVPPRSPPKAPRMNEMDASVRKQRHQYQEEVLARMRRRLSATQQERIESAWAVGSGNDEILCKYATQVDRRKLRTLCDGTWANDEVCNFWMALLAEACRDRFAARAPQGNGPKPTSKVKSDIHIQNSFFYQRLLGSGGGYDYSNVVTWTKDVDVFAMQSIVFPINVSNSHWYLAVIRIPEKTITYYDSQGGTGQNCLEDLRRWLCDEPMNKRNVKLDQNEWTFVSPQKSVPQQNNNDDCGIFMCLFAECLCCAEEELPFAFSHVDMSHMRRRIGLSVMDGVMTFGEGL